MVAARSRSLALSLLLGSVLAPRSALAEQGAPAKQASTAAVGMDATVAGVIAEPFEGARTLGDWGYGLLLSLGLHWKALPLSAGLDVLPIRWGSATSLVDVRLGDTNARAELTRQDQTVILGSWLRLQPPPPWRIRPFIEGLAGIKLLSTTYSLSFGSETGSTSTTSEKNTASNLGFGAGVDVLLANASDGSGSAVFATLGVRELWGSSASFTRARDSNSPNQTIGFDVPTRTTVVELGFSIRAQRKIEAAAVVP